MGILINKDTRTIVQGMTGKQGSYHCVLMREYGTRIVAGVTPGKGGTILNNVPVFDMVEEAVKKFTPNASIIFVPAESALEAAMEAIDNKIKTIVIITERLPIKDAISLIYTATQAQVTIIGPNTPGVITPGECKLGVMPANVFTPGNVGLISRSGTLTYEIASNLTKEKIGQSTCLGVGGDPIVGFNFIESLKRFKDDEQTKAIVIIGEIGGNLEELTAQYISQTHYPKPVVAFIAGVSAPPEKRMGHAGAIIMNNQGTAKSKIEAFTNAGVKVAEKPSDIAKLLIKELGTEILIK